MIVLMVYLLKFNNIAEVQAVKFIILWRSDNTWGYKRALNVCEFQTAVYQPSHILDRPISYLN